MFDYNKIDINNLVKYLNDNIDKFSYANIDKFSYNKINVNNYLVALLYQIKSNTTKITILADFNLISVDKTINKYIDKYLLENYNLERIIL